MDYERENDSDSEGPPKKPIWSNYRQITCLPMMGKILTAEIREKKSITRLYDVYYFRNNKNDTVRGTNGLL